MPETEISSDIPIMLSFVLTKSLSKEKWKGSIGTFYDFWIYWNPFLTFMYETNQQLLSKQLLTRIKGGNRENVLLKS